MVYYSQRAEPQQEHEAIKFLVFPSSCFMRYTRKPHKIRREDYEQRIKF